MISPAEHKVDMPIGNTFVGMVDRDKFDPWLRARAEQNGATLHIGVYKGLHYDDQGVIHLSYDSKEGDKASRTVTTRAVIGGERRCTDSVSQWEGVGCGVWGESAMDSV